MEKADTRIATFDTDVIHERKWGSTWVTFLPSGVLSGHGRTANDPTLRGLSGSALTTGARGCFFSDPRQVRTPCLGVTGVKSSLRVTPVQGGGPEFTCGSFAGRWALSSVEKQARVGVGAECPPLLCAQPMVAQREIWGRGFSWRRLSYCGSMWGVSKPEEPGRARSLLCRLPNGAGTVLLSPELSWADGCARGGAGAGAQRVTCPAQALGSPSGQSPQALVPVGLVLLRAHVPVQPSQPTGT